MIDTRHHYQKSEEFKRLSVNPISILFVTLCGFPVVVVVSVIKIGQM